MLVKSLAKVPFLDVSVHTHGIEYAMYFDHVLLYRYRRETTNHWNTPGNDSSNHDTLPISLIFAPETHNIPHIGTPTPKTTNPRILFPHP
jgi:hypothetical protein